MLMASSRLLHFFQDLDDKFDELIKLSIRHFRYRPFSVFVRSAFRLSLSIVYHI